MKKRRKISKATTSKSKSIFFKPAILLSLFAAIAATVGISAYAGNALLHESAIKQSIQKFEPTAEDLQVTADPESRHQEVMPTKAKAVKSREEVKQLLAQGSGSNSAFLYDPWGRLAQVTEPDGSIRQFLYIGDKMSEERDGTGAVTKRFFEWGQMIGSTKYFYNRDHLGSVREMLDTSGNVVASYGYDSYGQVTKLSGTGADSDFLFAGYFYHRPSKLYITAHRVYSPKLARWLSRDPIQDHTFAMVPDSPEVADNHSRVISTNAGQFSAITNDPVIQRQLNALMPKMQKLARHRETNPYTYALNNPIGYRDPSGLAACPSNDDGDDGAWEYCEKICKPWEKDALQWILCMERCLAGK